jgi:hypothetical protein
MYARTFLHNRFLKSFPSIHQVRLKCVIDAVDSILRCQHLQLTAIGRGINNNVADKHCIKRIDRLLGNRQLNVERFDFYKWIAKQTLKAKKHPVILVDYSDVNPLQTHFIIRAAVSVRGRALTVYEEVHERLNNPVLLRGFVQALSKLLPKNCQPIVVTVASHTDVILFAELHSIRFDDFGCDFRHSHHNVSSGRSRSHHSRAEI